MTPGAETIGLRQDMTPSKYALKASIEQVGKHQGVEEIAEIVYQPRVWHPGHVQNAHN